MLPAHNFPIFVDYYAMFVLVCHSVKKGLYAFFKSHRKEWNNMADREEMEEHIVQNLGFEIPPGLCLLLWCRAKTAKSLSRGINEYTMTLIN
ncbi:MAG: hypothetical protein SOV62_07215 [Alloprevotella sp.]|nr:hypothetical protein [Alloprevotella sp.]